jgi:hypothetical protein
MVYDADFALAVALTFAFDQKSKPKPRSGLKFRSTLFKGWQGVKGDGGPLVAPAGAKHP